MPRPEPPHPALTRSPTEPFGWLDARLLREDWLAQLGPDATALLTLLALAADRRGASFYGRERMGRALSLSRDRIDRALARLLELQLVAQRPWRPGHPDGVWQLLPLRAKSAPPRGGEPVRIADVVDRLRRER
ncbi:MAG: hypothetical protein HY720_33005 [Planctomycetes bacterium]|nr:hypothetical protein [Planctomycetota bacterium]